MRLALAFVEAHPDEPVSVLAVCQAVGASERSLHRALHEVYGHGFRDFERQRRLHRAHGAILAEGDRRSITDIAMSLGF